MPSLANSDRGPDPWLNLWVSLCAWLTAGGWMLSAVHHLDGVGYAVLLAAFVLFWGTVLRRGEAPIPCRVRRWRRNLRRLLSVRRALPMIFALSALVILMRGLVVPPTNDDGLSYRIPRVLHWLHTHGWEWIAAEDLRLNTRGTVSEWLFAPLLLLTHWGPSVILPGWISHLFLPGLIFRAWRNLGVSRRVAWIWMWLLPTAFCFSFQAGSVSNDALAAFFALVVFALVPTGGRAPTFGTLALAVVSAALMSGTKPNVIPLGLVFVVLLAPWWRGFVRRPVAAAGAGVVAALVSFAPNAIFNYVHLHDFIGLSHEPYLANTGGPPQEMFLGNVGVLAIQNLMPPFLLHSPRWPAIQQSLNESPLGRLVIHHFEQHALQFYPHLAVEQVGLGFIILLVGAVIWLLTRNDPGGGRGGADARAKRRRLVRGAIWLVLLQFLCTSPASLPARLLCAYYAPVLGAVFAWRRLGPGRAFAAARLSAALAMLLGTYCLAGCTENPLVPTFPSFNWRQVDEAYRAHHLARVLPAGTRKVGLIRPWWEREAWLWQPYGTRFVQQFPVEVTPQAVRAQGIQYVLISRQAMMDGGYKNFSSWAEAHGVDAGDCIDRPAGWYLVRFDAPGASQETAGPTAPGELSTAPAADFPPLRERVAAKP